MRRSFVKMYITADDILLTETFTHEPVHILCPKLYFRHPFELGIFRIITCPIHYLLIPERQLAHLVLRPAQNEIHDSAVFRFGQTLIRVFYATLQKVLCHAFRNGLSLIHRLDPASFDDLEIQAFPPAVIRSFRYGVLPTAFSPVALVLVALCGTEPFHHVHVHHLP